MNITKVPESSDEVISTMVINKNTNISRSDNEEMKNKKQDTKNRTQTRNEVITKTRNMIKNKYGLVEDYRESKVLFSRRMDLRGHQITTVNVITDTNETRKHLDDRL